MIGTGSLHAHSFSSCALIDDAILLDCPNGFVKRLRNMGINFNKIKVMLITHFHGDHDFDMPFLLREYKMLIKRTEPLILVAPKGARERYLKLYEMAFSKCEAIFDDAKIEIIEIDETFLSKGIIIDGYEISVYHVEHSVTAYGYKISKENKVVAFTGDTVLCDNCYELIKGAGMAFADVTLPNAVPVHMGIADIEKLRDTFPNCKIMPTHMSEDAREKLKQANFDVPKDGDVFVL